MAERRKKVEPAMAEKKAPRKSDAVDIKKKMAAKDSVAAAAVPKRRRSRDEGNEQEPVSASRREEPIISIDPTDVEDKGGRVAGQKRRKPTIEDGTSAFLAKFDSETLVTQAFIKARKLPHFKYVNVAAFEKNEKLAKNTAPGLLRMRLGNLLRAADRKLEAAKADK